MTDLFTPDPENDPVEEAELTYRLQEAIHEFVKGPNGRCIEPVRKYCYEHEVIDYHNPCNAESYSVLHYEDTSSKYYGHDHGGGDCMCFEGEPW